MMCQDLEDSPCRAPCCLYLQGIVLSELVSEQSFCTPHPRQRLHGVVQHILCLESKARCER